VVEPLAHGVTDDSLAGFRVVDFSTQIAGPYCSKLLVAAGAEVVKVEPPEGDGLRADPLFAFLNAGKRSVVGELGDGHVDALVAGADLVVEAHGLATDNGAVLDVERLRQRHPHLVVLSITPYGRTGPWADRAAT
jgi:crotonobetainyl-CoA:carnitine CoA-transferase CaiB-like acyl-CoA transferase